MKKIEDYVNIPEDWHALGNIVPEYSFFNYDLGLQIIMSIDNHGFLNCIHVSIAPIRSLKKCSSEKEYEELIVRKAPEIIHSFFGEREFARAPSDSKNPTNKHFFALMKEND